jgi:hypothetical protein
MKEDVKHYVRTCVKCQNTKLVHKKKFRLYKPLPIPSGPFELASRIEVKQPMDLTIFRTKGIHHKGNKEAEKMVKDHEKRKSWAIKFLQKV